MQYLYIYIYIYIVFIEKERARERERALRTEDRFRRFECVYYTVQYITTCIVLYTTMWYYVVLQYDIILDSTI